MKTRYIEAPRRRRPRRHKRCGCRRNQSPIVDTFHTPFMRWTLTALALLSLAASMGWPFVIATAFATVAWNHR